MEKIYFSSFVVTIISLITVFTLSQQVMHVFLIIASLYLLMMVLRSGYKIFNAVISGIFINVYPSQSIRRGTARRPSTGFPATYSANCRLVLFF